MNVVAMVVEVVVVAGLPAYALSDSPWIAVGLAPLIYAVFATVAGMVATVLQLPTLWTFVPLVVAGNVAAVRRAPNRSFALARHLAQPVAGAVVTAAAFYCLIPLKAPLLGGDTRTHWLGPARLFFGGGHDVWSYIGNAAYGHRDYPPLIAATVGTMWRLQGHIDLRGGQIMISLCNFGAIVLVGCALPRLFPRVSAVAAAAGSGIVVAAYGFAGPYGNDGYADLLWGAAASAAVLYLLLAPRTPVNTSIGYVAVVVAALTKNEGTTVAIAIILLACWRRRRERHDLYLVASALPVVLFWPVYTRLRGVPGGLYEASDVKAFLRLDPRI